MHRSISDDEGAKFVRETFFAKECKVYVPAPHRGPLLVQRAGVMVPFVQQDSDDGKQMEVCYCGGKKKKHYNLNRVETRETMRWSPDECIGKIRTNAYGRIKFIPADISVQKKSTKYVRLADDTNMSDVQKLLVRCWRLMDYSRKTELVISIIGDSFRLNLKDELKNRLLNRDLMKAVKTTNGCLLTNGLDAGITKDIGQAVRQSQRLSLRDPVGGAISGLTNSINCIGVASWGAISNVKSLINTNEGMMNASYTVADTGGSSRSTYYLNPNHTHFLLVDDGFRYNKAVRSIAKFRARLERQIALGNDNGLGIPVVCILIQGGLVSIQHVLESAKRSVPVLLCEGTGGIADILANACRAHVKILNIQGPERNIKLEEFKNNLRETLAVQFYTTVYRKHVELIDKSVDQILEICNWVDSLRLEKKEIIYAFNVNSNISLDTAILNCLVRCQSLKNWKDQLMLALRLNRADVAKTQIFSRLTPAELNDEQMKRFFFDALEKDQIEFVKFFLDARFDVHKWLNPPTLKKLYNETMKSLFAGSMLRTVYRFRRTGGDLKLVDIHRLIKRCTRRFNNEAYEFDDGRKIDDDTIQFFEKPFQELFIWALLLCRCDLALLFWEHCKQPLQIAVIGTLICDRYHHILERYHPKLARSLIVTKDALESLAVDIITVGFVEDPEKTLRCLHRNWKMWGDVNCMEIAALATDKVFLASEVCQVAIWLSWRRGFDASPLKIFLATFTVFPVLGLIHFDMDTQFIDESKVARLIAKNGSKRNSIEIDRFRQLETRISDLSSRISKFQWNQNFTQQMTKIPRFDDQECIQQAIKDAEHENFTDGPSAIRHWSESPIDDSWLAKLKKFYTSPKVKFTYHSTFYTVYLLLYTYVILFSYRQKITVPEIALHVWTLTMLCDELYVLFSNKCTNLLDKLTEWWTYGLFSAWSRLDILTISVELLALLLRWWPETFAVARLIMAVNFILCLVRFTRVYYVNKYLGPKIVMFKRMAWDLLMFLMVFVITLLAYTIVSQALLHPNRGYYSGIFWDLFHRGLWVLFGELQGELEHVSFSDCLSNENLTGTAKFDCVISNWPPAILLATYCFIGNILLVNMLIAAFTYVFQEVQDHSEQLWRYYMYFLVKEYVDKLMLPAPFNVFECIYRAMRLCWNSCIVKNSQVKKNETSSNLELQEEPLLQATQTEDIFKELLDAYESFIQAEVIDRRRAIANDGIEAAISRLQEEMTANTAMLKAIQSSINEQQKLTATPKVQFVDDMPKAFPRPFSMPAMELMPATMARGRCASTLPPASETDGEVEDAEIIEDSNNEDMLDAFTNVSSI